VAALVKPVQPDRQTSYKPAIRLAQVLVGVSFTMTKTCGMALSRSNALPAENKQFS